MAKIPETLKAIGAYPNALVTFGYVLKDGTHVVVEGVVREYLGTPEKGITGIRLHYHGHRGGVMDLDKWKVAGGHHMVPFSVDGIDRGEQIRAERQAAQQRAERQAQRAANRATDKQTAYLRDLYKQAGQAAPDNLDEITKAEASERIDNLRDQAGKRTRSSRRGRGGCSGCGGPLNPHGDIPGLSAVDGRCYDCI